MRRMTNLAKQTVAGSSDRSFGVVFTIVFTLIGFWPLQHALEPRWWALVLAVLFSVAALATPKILAPLNRIWTRFGLLLHTIVSPVILALMFFGVFTPMGFVKRLFGSDDMGLSFDAKATSYWKTREPPGPTPESMKNQF